VAEQQSASAVYRFDVAPHPVQPTRQRALIIVTRSFNKLGKEKARDSFESRASTIMRLLLSSEAYADTAVDIPSRYVIEVRHIAVRERSPRNRRLLVEQVVDTEGERRVPRGHRVAQLDIAVDRGTQFVLTVRNKVAGKIITACICMEDLRAPPGSGRRATRGNLAVNRRVCARFPNRTDYPHPIGGCPRTVVPVNTEVVLMLRRTEERTRRRSSRRLLAFTDRIAEDVVFNEVCRCSNREVTDRRGRQMVTCVHIPTGHLRRATVLVQSDDVGNGSAMRVTKHQVAVRIA